MEEGRRSWGQLRQAVRQARCRLYAHVPRLPSGVCFSKSRIYFLSPLAGGRESSLHYADLPPPGTQAPLLPWKPLLEPKFHVVHPPGRLSREEQLQWERRRLMVWGITSFDQLGQRFVFPAGGSLFCCDDDKEAPHFPVELRSGLSSARLNAQLCPCNRDLVAFVSAGDLWVHHISSGCETRITHTRPDWASASESPVSVGIPSYVTQEEFNRYVGFWWNPTSDGSTYWLLYEQVDETEVEVVHLPCFGEDGSSSEVHRFPRAGTLNARSTLLLAQFALDSQGQIGDVRLLSPSEPLSSVCSASEYLLRAGWTPDGVHAWAQFLDRRQQHLQLVLLPRVCFQGDDEPCRPGQEPQVIWEEKSHVWINVHDILHFLSTEEPQTLRFLWASEESGFRHLYVICLRLQEQLQGAGGRLISKVQLTSGDWEVSERDVWLDEPRGLVYFMGLKDTPLERHLYVVGLDRPMEVSRLTTMGCSHTVFMNEDRSLFVTVQSSLSQPPSSGVYRLVRAEEPGLPPSAQLVGILLEATRTEAGYLEPELFSHTLGSGHTVYGLVFKPPRLEPQRKYPTVLTIYGGPEVQLVTNSFKGMRHLRQHLLASENYVVVLVDCRGSRHRGVDFESYLKGRMGTVEIADQVEVLQWLAQTRGYIDLDRVGIHGWSYGGYLSLMGLAQRPDLFKVAVAGAPVTSWNLYDTGYTERYMDTPANNAQGYARGSVLSYVSQFPTEQNRLLIVHGLMDENVHFSHTSQLVGALVKAGKPYQLQVYPAERHSLRHLDTSEHYETTLLSFLQDHL